MYHSCYFILLQFLNRPASKESQEVTRESHLKGGASEKPASFNARSRVLSQVASLAIIRTLRSYDDDGNKNVKKAIGLITKTTILHVHHAFLYISLPLLHDYDVKMPNFTFNRRSNTSDDEIELGYGP